MTDQEINIAIAEECGWKWVTTGPLSCPWVHPETKWQYARVPSYCTDLNAMHEAENHLGSINALGDYADALDKVCVPTHICHLTHWQSVVMAEARQRAEAFLRVKGKWKE